MSALIVGLALGFVGGVIACEKLDVYYRGIELYHRGRQAWRRLVEWLAFR